MAQTMAFQFWLSSLKDGKDTWNRYLGFVDAGGRKTFEQLVTDAGLKLPYSDGAMKEVCGKVGEWISEHQLG